uniref:Dehydrogenase/reductase SDR family member 8 n=1 Tax=Elaeophora elaphi TaxID=1147741 RepID=A0A158Q6V5_9BILA
MARISRKERFYSSIGMLLHVLFVAVPLDFWYWFRSSLKSVNGRTVVITGGASGIGKRLAELFAIRLGAKVAILDINQHGAQETVDNIVKSGGIAQCWKCDISQVEEVNECARQINIAFGNVDIIICNAAVLYIGRMLDLTISQLQNSLDVNVMGMINTVRAFLHSMEQRNEGQIVAISSIAGFCGGTNGIMQCLEMEMKDKGLNGIRCTTVCPYFTRTPMILNLRMRPTSMWLPFMSINRCACEIADAILREKNIAFVPHYISIIAHLKGLLSERVENACREYLNCRYEPLKDEEVEEKEITTTKKTDYFKGLDASRQYVLLTAYLILMTGYLMMQGAVQSVLQALLLFITSSNLVLAIYALHICDQLQFSFPCKFQWFTQIFCFGFISFLQLYPMNDFFKSPHLIWWILVPVALFINFMTWYNPHWFGQFGMSGRFLELLGARFPSFFIATNLFALIAHFGESLYSLKLCNLLHISRNNTLKWMLQTFILGYPSLRILLNQNTVCRDR